MISQKLKQTDYFIKWIIYNLICLPEFTSD
jgi:hypothetical protein